MRKFHAVAVANQTNPVYYNEPESSVMFQIDNGTTFYRYLDELMHEKAVEIAKAMNLLEEHQNGK